MATLLDEQGERLARVVVVLDDENATCTDGRSFGLASHRFGRHWSLRHRHPDGKFASSATPLARSLDGAAVQLDEPAHQSQAESESAARPVEWRRPLHEQIECMRQHLGRHSLSRIAHFEDQPAIVLIGNDGDPPTGRCELHRVVHKVGDDLPEARGIDVQPHSALRNVDGELLALLGDQVPPGLHRRSDDVVKSDTALLQFHAPASDSGDVEKIVDQVRQMLRLPTDDVARTFGGPRIAAQQLD